MLEKRIGFFIALLCALYPQRLFSHELFSLRAQIARTGGFNFDGLIHQTKQSHQRETDFLASFMYGFNQFITGELRIPIKLDNIVYETSTQQTFKAQGLDKVHLLGRFRIYKNYKHAKRYQIVVIPGIFFPTASGKLTPQENIPLIASKSVDFLLGIAGAFETLKWYHFAGFNYKINTQAKKLRQGNVFLYSYAIGYRPVPPEASKPDWVFLWEIDGILKEKDHYHGVKNNNSGSNIIFTGPALFCSLDNVMLKADIQFPAFQHLNGKQERFDWRGTLGIYTQF